MINDKLELSVTTPTPASTRVVQQASKIEAPQWIDVANATFSSGPAGAVVAASPKPTNSPAFYRVVIR